MYYQLILEKQRQVDQDIKTKKSKKTHRADRLVISVTKYHPEDFRQIVEFIHCGTVDISPSNVTGKQ